MEKTIEELIEEAFGDDVEPLPYEETELERPQIERTTS
jgi:hypothetical protein